MSDNIFRLRAVAASLIIAIQNHYGKFLKKNHINPRIISLVMVLTK